MKNTSLQTELPDTVNLEDLLSRLRILSWESADILKAYARGNKPPHGLSSALDIKEGKEGPVTAADLAVSCWLLDGLKKAFPNAEWSMISEETAKNNDQKILQNKSDWIWILDPLDGTRDFINGSGDYAIHLALIYKHYPVLGVIVIPEIDELWFGISGIGSWREDRKAKRFPPTFKKLDSIKDIVLVASKTHREKKLEKIIDKLEIRSEKAVGSVGCKIANILRGESDFYISISGKTSPKDWDLAAPDVVISSAGGKFTRSDDSRLTYNKGDFNQKGCLIASSGVMHNKVSAKIREIIEDIDC